MKNVLEVFIKGKPKGYLSLEEIHALRSATIITVLTEKQLCNHLHRSENSDSISVKENLLHELNQYIEMNEDEVEGIMVSESVAEMEGVSHIAVESVIEFVETLDNEEVKDLLITLHKSEAFFHMFFVADTLKDLREQRAKAKHYESITNQCLDIIHRQQEIVGDLKGVTKEQSEELARQKEISGKFRDMIVSDVSKTTIN